MTRLLYALVLLTPSIAVGTRLTWSQDDVARVAYWQVRQDGEVVHRIDRDAATEAGGRLAHTLPARLTGAVAMEACDASGDCSPVSNVVVMAAPTCGGGA